MLWWIFRQLKSRDLRIRVEAARKLGESRDKRALKPLIAALRDGELLVCGTAAEALGDISDARAVEPLIAALKEGVLIVKVSAPWALGKIGDARAVEPLIGALKDSDTRIGAAWALGEIGDARAVEPLIVAFKDSDSDVRTRAAEALGKIGDERAVKSLSVSSKETQSSLFDTAGSENQQFTACPTCGALSRAGITYASSKYGDDTVLRIYRCAYGSVYCDKCSGGGLITLPFCPDIHEDRKKIGFVPAQERKGSVVNE